MSGYMIISKPEFKTKDPGAYQSPYCGPCKALHEDLGRRGRLTLNSDLASLAILLTTLYEPEGQLVRERCVAHPTRRHVKRRDAYFHYAANMTTILTYLKREDDWKGEHRLQARSMLSLSKRPMERTEEAYPRKIQAIRETLQETAELEKAQSRDLDRLSSLSGMTMAEIVTYQHDE